MKRSERRRLRAIWLLAFIIVVTSASLLLIWPRYIEERHAALEERLETAMASLAQRRWERPPLGDESRPGNAVEASIHAARGLSELPLVGSRELAAALRSGEVPAELEPILEAQAERLHRFEQSALRTFSRRAGAFEPVSEPTLRDRRAGIHLMLARALQDDPLGCADRVAAAIRVAQDASAGGGLQEVAQAADEIDLALDVLPRCLETVDDEDLAGMEPNLGKLAITFRTLAEHPVPIGDALEHAALVQAIELVRATAPTDAPLDVFRIRTTLERPAQLKTLEDVLDVAAQLVRLDTFAYPALLAEAVALVEGLPLGIEADIGRRMDALFVLRRHGEGVARSRAAAVALRDLAAPQEGAPEWLTERSLADPFDGAPLRYRLEEGSLLVWSVGHDGIDHRGSRELRAGDVPADVVFAIRSRRAPAEEPAIEPVSEDVSETARPPAPEVQADEEKPPEDATPEDAAPEVAPGVDGEAPEGEPVDDEPTREPDEPKDAPESLDAPG